MFIRIRKHWPWIAGGTATLLPIGLMIRAAQVEWLGLDWWDVILNVVVLAIVPGIFAVVGGYLATESINDKQRARWIELCFWGLFLFGFATTIWQQLRVAEADLSKQTRESWADSLLYRALIGNLPRPPNDWNLKTGSIRPVRPDVGLIFVNPTNPATIISLLKSTTARNVQVNSLLWDLDALSDTSSLLVRPANFDWIRKDQQGMPLQLLQSADIGSRVKPSHRIFGCVWVTCIDCNPASRAYWVYFMFGDTGGWYAELPEGTGPLFKPLSDKMPEIRDNTEAFLSQLVPVAKRKPILDVP